MVLILKSVFCSCDITSGGVYSGVWEGGEHARCGEPAGLVHWITDIGPGSHNAVASFLKRTSVFQHVNKA